MGKKQSRTLTKNKSNDNINCSSYCDDSSSEIKVTNCDDCDNESTDKNGTLPTITNTNREQRSTPSSSTILNSNGGFMKDGRKNFKKSGRTSSTKSFSDHRYTQKSILIKNDYRYGVVLKRLIKVSISACIYATLVLFSTVFVSKNHVTARPSPSVPSFFAPFKETQEAQNVSNLETITNEFPHNCTPPVENNFPPDLFSDEQRIHGAIIIHFLVSFYMFYALYLICDDYFVPSVESICREMKISSDVAGATFMAAATSFPEFFTNMIGTFITEGSLGVGTIMGSGVFNILMVAAVCGIGVSWTVEKLKSSDGRVGLPLECYSFTRDSIFYLLSVGCLIIILYDLKIMWYESVGMLLVYAVYIVVLRYNLACKRLSEKVIHTIQLYCCSSKGFKEKKHLRISVRKTKTALENTPLLFTQNEKGVQKRAKIDGDSSPSTSGESSDLSLSSEDYDDLLISKALLRSASYCIDEKTDWDVFSVPREQPSLLVWVEWIASWPIRFAFTLTIPDCREYSWRKWYPLTLIMCVVWIGLLSYVASWMLTTIGDTLGIPESVTGLTFLAAGTSIPEITSSIIVARQGLGAMALSNSVGSNTFDILVCLGTPWLLKSLLIMGDDVNYIHMDAGGLEYSAILMTVTLLILYAMLLWNGFLLDKKVGWTALILYIIFIVFSIMLEMGVFFQVSLPMCSQEISK